jgi:hypothetical protein
MDVARAEKVEKELDKLVTRRSKEKDVEEQSEAWQKSVRRFNEQRRQMARLEWHAFHCGQAERHRRTLRELINYHETQAERLLTEG